MVQRSVPQAVPPDSEQVSDISATEQKIKSLSLYHCVRLLIYTYYASLWRISGCAGCLSQEGVGCTKEKQLFLLPIS